MRKHGARIHVTKTVPKSATALERRRVHPIIIAGVLAAAAVAAVAAAGYASARFGAGVELKILGIALAVGFDVLALSIAVGIMRISWSSRVRLCLAFAGSEVFMQGVGYIIGTGAGRMVGVIAIYVGFAVLAGVGLFILRASFTEENLNIDTALGALAACASISLDSLGIGISLPGVPLPLFPLLGTVATSTLVFTAVGLAFGARLGDKYRRAAERAAGIVLVVLAIFFTIQHVAGWSAQHS